MSGQVDIIDDAQVSIANQIEVDFGASINKQMSTEPLSATWSLQAFSNSRPAEGTDDISLSVSSVLAAPQFSCNEYLE